MKSLALVAFVVGVLVSNLACSAQPRLIDDFDPIDGWEVSTSDGVVLKTSPDAAGFQGGCLRLDYDFTRGSGYGIIRKRVDLALPPNYRFDFKIRGEGPSNTLEFKLIDQTGDNVWWLNQPNFGFQTQWQDVRIPRRKISFAWGPAGADVPLTQARWLEIVVTSYNGGKGTVWLDELTLEEVPEPKAPAGPAKVNVSSARDEAWQPTTIEADGSCRWAIDPKDAKPRLSIDFGEACELGGLVLSWIDNGYRQNYEILSSADGVTYTLAAKIRDSDGRTDYVAMPDMVTRYLAIECAVPEEWRKQAPLAGGVEGGEPAPTATNLRARELGLTNIRVMPLEFGDSSNMVISSIARDQSRGHFPRQFLGEATYWTIAGVGDEASGDEHEVLIDEGGAIEVTKSGFSLEPMIFERVPGAPGGRGAGEISLHTWANGMPVQSLVDGYVPAPIVRREHDGLTLEVKSVVDGKPGDSTLLVKYTLTNTTSARRNGVLQVLIRPYQVNPVYQWLNTHGGVGKINRLAFENGSANVDGTLITPLKNPTNFGATRFEQGEVVEYLARGVLPSSPIAEDRSGLASGVLAFRFALEPGESMIVPIAAGLHGQASGFVLGDEARSLAEFDARFAAAVAGWKSRLDRVSIRLPRSAERLMETVKANLAYILINRDGASIHPGSRSYERAWIRDGSLTSAALLSFGFEKEAMAFADWFGPFQYDNGKVPCCVDRRGPDPVPEHDSHGQYIWLVRNIFMHTGDSAFLTRHYPRVLKAVEYIEFLRAQRMTPEYASAEGLKKGMFGLMPESISHEGYSAKPMHSYWDQFFAARGIADAANIAELMGDAPSAARLAKLRDEFKASVVASLDVAMREKGIDYLPGCVELGDFDATSTTVALWPCGLRGTLSETALRRTFDKYFEFFRERAAGQREWKDYTPYEHRVVGSMVMLGERERAHQMWDWFFLHQRPEGWRHWAEVVWKDDRAAKFIGDMPHTWVGSDFINAFRSMFVYERSDGAMVIGAGLTRAWLRQRSGTDEPPQSTDDNSPLQLGVAVRGLKTPAGALSVRAWEANNQAVFSIDPLQTLPSAGVWLSPPTPEKIETVEITYPGKGQGLADPSKTRAGTSVKPGPPGLFQVHPPCEVLVKYRD